MAGTTVETQGGPQPIEEIREGNLVLSRDEKTGEVSYQPVSATFTRYGVKTYELTAADRHGVVDLIERPPSIRSG